MWRGFWGRLVRLGGRREGKGKKQRSGKCLRLSALMAETSLLRAPGSSNSSTCLGLSLRYFQGCVCTLRKMDVVHWQMSSASKLSSRLSARRKASCSSTNVFLPFIINNIHPESHQSYGNASPRYTEACPRSQHDESSWPLLHRKRGKRRQTASTRAGRCSRRE